MINHNTIKWLIPLLSNTDRLSDYTLGRFFVTENKLYLCISRVWSRFIDEFMFTNKWS